MIASLLLFLLFLLFNGDSSRGGERGRGAIRFSSLKSQMPAGFPPPARRRCAPGPPGEVGTWRGKSRARVPGSPAPAPSSGPPAASARRRSPEPLAGPPSRARSSLLFRAFLSARSRAPGLRPPRTASPRTSAGESAGGARGAGRGRQRLGPDSQPIGSGRPK